MLKCQWAWHCITCGGTLQPVQVRRVICMQLNGTSMLNGAPEKLESLWQDITHEFGTSLG